MIYDFGLTVSQIIVKYFCSDHVGGAGPTILTATFLLLGEDVLTYEKGREVYKKSAIDSITRDFGESIGKREGI